MKTKLFLLIGLFLMSGLIQAGDTENPVKKYSISGYIKDKNTGEMLIGGGVYVPEIKSGVAANVYGFYSLSLPEGDYNFVYSYVGYASVEKKIHLDKNMQLDMELQLQEKLMNEVVISENKSDENVKKTEMSSVALNVDAIRSIPALLGETDLIKAIQLLPGVQTAGEGSSGFNVRGGSTDQNLVLLDEAAVYNASHLMGFFSVFNPDAIKDVKLYKGDIPSEYGGRLASLLDIRMKDGNKKEYKASGGIGTISSRLTFEGPIIRDKSSFVVSARRTYADVFLKFANDTNLRKNRLYFYDLNLKFNYDIDRKNRIFISSYLGKDYFRFGDAFRFAWGNNTETVRWNHVFNDKLFSNFTFVFSNYSYLLGSGQSAFKFDWDSYLRDVGVKADFTWYLNTKNTLRYGLTSTYHRFFPGEFVSNSGTEVKLTLPYSNALEHAVFIGNEQTLLNPLTVNYGIRFSAFQNVGKGTSYNYNDKFESIDSTTYKSGEVYNTYTGLEPRASASYILGETSSLKASYSRTRQYIQLASNSTVGSPIDIWYPASPNVKPQISDQVAVGYFRNFKKNVIETSVEMYYKNMKNQIDFKDFANLILNPKLEGELRFGKAWSYGAELLIRKASGKLNGWVGYTISRSERQFDDINNGDVYLSNYDKTHNVSVVANYKISKRVEASLCWVYITGSPITLPTGRFEFAGIVMPVYTERNGARMPDYHRLDLGVTLKPSEKNTHRWKGEWTFSVYNAYNRKNAYSIFFEADKADPYLMKSFKLSMFPIIPAITYNFKF
ncbi:MAG: TonB-dependent receptor [Bacteroidota bacterium]